jgi:hypothetical protein
MIALVLTNGSALALNCCGSPLDPLTIPRSRVVDAAAEPFGPGAPPDSEVARTVADLSGDERCVGYARGRSDAIQESGPEFDETERYCIRSRVRRHGDRIEQTTSCMNREMEIDDTKNLRPTSETFSQQESRMEYTYDLDRVCGLEPDRAGRQLSPIEH